MRRILIGERYLSRLENGLKAAGFKPAAVPDNPFVDKRLAGHVDLSVFKSDEKTLIVSRHLLESSSFVNQLTNELRIIPAALEQSKEYPHDINLCVCTVGDRLIHNIKYTDPKILQKNEKQFFNVRQGYTNCMICVVDNNAIITPDPGIAKAAESAGMEVLRIKAGIIGLEGFDTGFIGGASFSHEETIYFTGSLDAHPDRHRIENFITSHGKSVFYLSTARAFDAGGAIVL